MEARAIMLNQDIMEWLEAITDLSHCFMAIRDLSVDIYTLAVDIGILVMSIGTLVADIDIPVMVMDILAEVISGDTIEEGIIVEHKSKNAMC
jgi:hypothetical protein